MKKLTTITFEGIDLPTFVLASIIHNHTGKKVPAEN